MLRLIQDVIVGAQPNVSGYVPMHNYPMSFDRDASFSAPSFDLVSQIVGLVTTAVTPLAPAAAFLGLAYGLTQLLSKTFKDNVYANLKFATCDMILIFNG